MTNKDFVEKMLQACSAARAQGACFNDAVVIAQAALESGWGGSELTVKANNLFGIKAPTGWISQGKKTLDLPTKEWDKAKGWYTTVARWCWFEDWQNCILYYYRYMLQLPWFKDALSCTSNSDNFLNCLMPAPGQPGWATDPGYFTKIKTIGLALEGLGGPKWIA